MKRKSQNEKIILGLKIRKLRQERQLSFADFSKATGLSVSYLNEIEKGKKFPKEDKVAIIAEALGVNMDALISKELPRSFAIVDELLQSNFLNDLPLDVIGVDLSKVVEMIADAPIKVGAFVATLLEMSRNYALVEENFYFGALRSYLEMHDNYFGDLEKEVEQFIAQHHLPKGMAMPTGTLKRILEKEYGYKIIENGLKGHPELEGMRSVFLPKKNQLLLSEKLSNRQMAFQLGKEIGFNALGLSTRAFTSSLLRVNSFEEALSHFKAGYFSAALLINQESFKEDLNQFLSHPQWEESWLLGFLQKYQATPETLFQRITNILPEFFDLKNIFFLRTIYSPSRQIFKINRELHLGKKHPPHSNGLSEHYCRRWQSYSLLNSLKDAEKNAVRIGVQNSVFPEGEEYLCLTVVTKSSKDKLVSVTIGILKNEEVANKIKFINDPKIPRKEVNTTCERCPIQNCESRAVPAFEIDKKEKYKTMMKAIEKLSK